MEHFCTFLPTIDKYYVHISHASFVLIRRKFLVNYFYLIPFQMPNTILIHYLIHYLNMITYFFNFRGTFYFICESRIWNSRNYFWIIKIAKLMHLGSLRQRSGRWCVLLSFLSIYCSFLLLSQPTQGGGRIGVIQTGIIVGIRF